MKSEDGKYELVEKQIRYYFSIDNLCRDIHLRKQMDEEGFISEEVISNFNRVKSLSGGDFSIVERVLANMTNLERVDGKVRLRDGWEKWVFRK